SIPLSSSASTGRAISASKIRAQAPGRGENYFTFKVVSLQFRSRESIESAGSCAEICPPEERFFNETAAPRSDSTRSDALRSVSGEGRHSFRHRIFHRRPDGGRSETVGAHGRP